MAGAGPLLLRFTRKRDESVVLDLRRTDGTSTWQRRAGATGRFFAVHDLTHFAEMIVASFATAWASGVVPNAADCNAGMDSYADEHGIAPLQHVTEDEMLRIREALAPRLRAWNELPVGETMELHFSE